MALGRRRREQQEIWVATTDLPRSPGHPFYRKLNELLAEAGFDAWIEALVAPYDEWQSKTDPDSRIALMKDKSTHLAYKAEHVLDEATDLVLAAEVYHADHGDTQTLVDSVMQAQVNVEAAGSDAEIEEVAADKGYHAAATLELADSLNLRTYIPERKQKHRSRWTDKPAANKRCVYNNRRRMKGSYGKALGKRRSELVERSFAHLCETGGGRRCWLKGLTKVKKRYLIQAAARNLGLILRQLCGIGSARCLQGARALVYLLQLTFIRVQIALILRYPCFRTTQFRFQLSAG